MLDYTPFMRHAIALAERGRWTACPNPTVGAVLVHAGKIVAEGWHHAAGGAHAEVECLRDATAKGINPAECTLLVTLEPCNHFGKTPPCADLVIAAGIRHVIIGMRDPNPVAAGGIEKLRAAGIQVECGLCEQECRDLVADFLCWQAGRPYLILKMATTLDGRIATRTGHSQWISSLESRTQVHELRAKVGQCGGMVLIGGNTFRVDNPSLTARVDGYNGPQPLACIITSRLPTVNADFKLLQQRPNDCIFLTSPAVAASPVAASLRKNGVHVLSVEQNNRIPDFKTLFQQFYAENNCHYILCEGGGKIGLTLLNAGLVDEFCIHIAPLILGDQEAKPLFDGLSPLHLDDALALRITNSHICGGDMHLTLRPRTQHEESICSPA